MNRVLTLRSAGPGLTLQDAGRPGYLDFGLSRGGAADRLALAEGAALLGQPADNIAIEMAGMGGVFEASQDLRIALSGAPMRAEIDGTALPWNSSQHLPAGAQLRIGAVQSGCYGYLHVGGGIRAKSCLGAGSAHLAAGIGAPLQAGDRLEVGDDPGSTIGLTLPPDPRFAGGELRMVASFQTDSFAEAERDRFQTITFRRGTRANRMGVELVPDGDGIRHEGGRNVVSEVIVPGDIQITGDGTPFVLMSECQTTGGYPRIGSVLPCDLPRVAQAPVGAKLRFRFVELAEAVALERAARAHAAGLSRNLQPLLRDPHRMGDLLSYQLISGAITGDEEEV